MYVVLGEDRGLGKGVHAQLKTSDEECATCVRWLRVGWEIFGKGLVRPLGSRFIERSLDIAFSSSADNADTPTAAKAKKTSEGESCIVDCCGLINGGEWSSLPKLSGDWQGFYT